MVRVDATSIYLAINRNGPYMAPKAGSASGGPRMNSQRWTFTLQPYLITEQSVVTRITGSTGHGLYLRKPADEFTGANLAACRVARDTYFSAAANAAALREFQDNQSLAIILNPPIPPTTYSRPTCPPLWEPPTMRPNGWTARMQCRAK